MFRTVFIVVTLVVLSGCASTPRVDPVQRYSAPTTIGSGVSLTNQSAVRRALHQHHREWQGVPYRYGGSTKAGADCSGLVYVVYRDQFGLGMPRTTSQLRQVGRPVADRRQLQAGDLVFFRGRDIKHHVGIYISDGQFLHASSRRGVMLSNIDSSYWSARFYTARRVE